MLSLLISIKYVDNPVAVVTCQSPSLSSVEMLEWTVTHTVLPVIELCYLRLG